MMTMVQSPAPVTRKYNLALLINLEKKDGHTDDHALFHKKGQSLIVRDLFVALWPHGTHGHEYSPPSNSLHFYGNGLLLAGI